MRPDERRVLTFPLAGLWDDRGPVPAHRARDLRAVEIQRLLRRGPVRFVMADVGLPLIWIAGETCFAYWKKHVRPRLVEDPGEIRPGAYPGGVGYLASEWTTTGGRPVVLLELYH